MPSTRFSWECRRSALRSRNDAVQRHEELAVAFVQLREQRDVQHVLQAQPVESKSLAAHLDIGGLGPVNPRQTRPATARHVLGSATGHSISSSPSLAGRNVAGPLISASRSVGRTFGSALEKLDHCSGADANPHLDARLVDIERGRVQVDSPVGDGGPETDEGARHRLEEPGEVLRAEALVG